MVTSGDHLTLWPQLDNVDLDHAGSIKFWPTNFGYIRDISIVTVFQLHKKKKSRQLVKKQTKCGHDSHLCQSHLSNLPNQAPKHTSELEYNNFRCNNFQCISKNFS